MRANPMKGVIKPGREATALKKPIAVDLNDVGYLVGLGRGVN